MTPRSATLAPYDVVVVPFPYTDALAEKRRPAVVISTPELESERGLVWLAMITSVPGDMQWGDAGLSDLSAAGLSKSCRVRASKVATLDVDRVLRHTGALSDADAEAVRLALKACAAP